jgi:hypothetical protein
MTTTSVAALPDGVIEHGGLLWMPKRGATATAEEFVAARSLIVDLHEDAGWNPWVLEDRAVDLEQAEVVFGQWRRAEPGFRPMTMKHWEAREARWNREFERARAVEAKTREERKQHYDDRSANARLRLLECQSILDRQIEEVAQFRDSTCFPRMDPARRDEEISKLDQNVTRVRAELGQLTAVVGDPEEVVDEHGRLPYERREIALLHFRLDRERRVRALREKIPLLQADLKASPDKKTSGDLGAQLTRATTDMEKLLAIAPLTAEQMCSECATPMASHGWVTPPFDGPCPAWPGWAARIRKAREMLEAAAERMKASTPAPPPPQPLAVISSKLPIAGVIERLTEIHRTYPDAEVRRGRANRWEIWPAAQAIPPTASS